MAEATVERVIEELNALKVGKYKGVVKRNKSDNKPPGWIEIQPISRDARGSSNRFWAEPCVPLAGPTSNSFLIPDPETMVWYEYAGGRLNHPIWTGCVWTESHALQSEDLNPKRKLLRVGAMEILIDEEASTLTLQNGQECKVVLTSDGITLQASKIELTVSGKTIKLDAAGFDVLQGALKVV